MTALSFDVVTVLLHHLVVNSRKFKWAQTTLDQIQNIVNYIIILLLLFCYAGEIWLQVKKKEKHDTDRFTEFMP